MTLIYIGLALAGICVAGYVTRALKLGTHPTLENAIHIALSAFGLMGVVRIMGFLFCGSFKQLLDDGKTNGDFFAVTEEDAVIFFIAALALGWVTVKLIWRPFHQLSHPEERD
jgi:hypothetical protein